MGGGGGGMSLQVSDDTRSTSGDASGGLSFPFNFSGNVQAGGSGNSQSADARQSAGPGLASGAAGGMGGPDQTLLYVALGVAGLAVLIAALRK